MRRNSGNHDKGYILNRINELEAERALALGVFERARGRKALQARAEIVVLERRLKWYRGRLGAILGTPFKTRPYAQKKAEKRIVVGRLAHATRRNVQATALPRPRRPNKARLRPKRVPWKEIE